MARMRRKPFAALMVFLALDLLILALAAGGLWYIRQPLQDKLEAYEAAQPKNQLDNAFTNLFSDPDWEALCRMASVEDTPYEGSEAFAAYMNGRITQPLTYREVFSPQENARRCLVLSGSEKIAAFSIIPVPGTGSWEATGMELFYERTESVSVEKRPGWTVYINGVALDDRFTVRTAETAAEAYLPEGVHGWRLEEQRLDGLLMPPAVTAVDENGDPVTLERLPGTNRYVLPAFRAEEIPPDLRQIARDAAVADATYALGELGPAKLKTYFDEASPLYAMIVKNPLNLQKYTSAAVDESSITVSDYRRYSQELFSARVKLTQNIIRKDGTLKVYKLDKTYFFTKNSSGKFLVTEYTNEDVTQITQQVRLTFAAGEPVSLMVRADAGAVAVPAADGPEGATFLGWATRQTDGRGNVTLQLRILPDGTAPGGLEPMTLYPVFDTL